MSGGVPGGGPDKGTHGILGKLAGGDRRSIGRADEVATEVLDNPVLFGELFDGIFAPDPAVRMRSADAAEKVTRQLPDLLGPRKVDLLRLAATADQKEMRWHAAQMLPRLRMDREERAAAVSALLLYLADESKIVQASAMQALAELAERDASLRPRVIGLLKDARQNGSPAVKSRARNLLDRLGKLGNLGL